MKSKHHISFPKINISSSHKKKNDKFENKNLDHLKLLIIFVKKGHGIAINQLLLDRGVAMTTIMYAEGAREKYVLDVLGAEQSQKEAVIAIVNEKKYKRIYESIEARFLISQASNGVLLTFNIKSLAGVLAYKYLSDYGRKNNYGKK